MAAISRFRRSPDAFKFPEESKEAPPAAGGGNEEDLEKAAFEYITGRNLESSAINTDNKEEKTEEILPRSRKIEDVQMDSLTQTLGSVISMLPFRNPPKTGNTETSMMAEVATQLLASSISNANRNDDSNADRNDQPPSAIREFLSSALLSFLPKPNKTKEIPARQFLDGFQLTELMPNSLR